jgi:alkanesulfonate monooxygenase SsuD/methylene tetrahydromethanopterin reductase-like flavin-dependent oxidoreductase (luciferase family)
MEIAIGLPNAVPGTTGKQLTEWARRSEAAGFSSLGTIDRIAYPNLEPLIALSAAAAVTEKIRLATTIMIAPFRENATVLAEQTASLQKISDGRAVLGLAVGGREDDYEAAGVDFGSRGKAFEAMIERMREVWKESANSSGSANHSGVGPDVADNPPKVVFGGSIDATFERAAKYGDGWIMGGGTPDALKEGKAKLEQAWSEAGREGKPRVMALAYFSLGDQAAENADAYLLDYYEWLGEYAQGIADSAAKDADTVKGYIQAFDAAGCDELFFIPSHADPDQVDLLADAAF